MNRSRPSFHRLARLSLVVGLSLATALAATPAFAGHDHASHTAAPSSSPSLSASASPKPPAAAPEVDYWTCSMHPSVRMKEPGACPLCGMELIPVYKRGAAGSGVNGGANGGAGGGANGDANGAAGGGANEFIVPVARQQQIGVTYATVETRALSRSIRAVGTVAADPRHTWAFVARVDGHVGELFVGSPGESVELNAPLLSIHSPELLTATRELRLLAAARKPGEGPDSLLEAARQRLRQWNLTAAQIAGLEKADAPPSESVTLRSPFAGVVTRLNAAQGGEAKAGETLVEIADLRHLRVWVDLYENELPGVRPGQRVEIAAAGLPGVLFGGTVAAIDPAIDPSTRAAKVRVDLPNTPLARPGTAPLEPPVEPVEPVKPLVEPPVEEAPAHGESAPAAAPLAPWALRPGAYVNATFSSPPVPALAVPVAAILPTGSRYVAFVEKGGEGHGGANSGGPATGRLEPRYVTLAGKFGDYYAVKTGLAEGERVVTSANFLIDAESKLQGALKSFEEPGEGAHAEKTEAEKPAVEPAKPAAATPAASATPADDAKRVKSFTETWVPRAACGTAVGGEPAKPSIAEFMKAYFDFHQLLVNDSSDHVAMIHLSDQLLFAADAFKEAGGAKFPAFRQKFRRIEGINLETARVYFGEISAALINLIKDDPALVAKVAQAISPTAAPTLYVFKCPMWEKGPNEWIQLDKATRNPWFGQAMPGCSDEVRVIGIQKQTAPTSNLDLQSERHPAQ